jgi:hypothetical protein
VRRQLTRRDLRLAKSAAGAARGILLVLLLLLGTTPQEHADAATQPLAAWPAPIGHRQPTAADVSSGRHSRWLDFDMLDKSLDEKLQICGGC